MRREPEVIDVWYDSGAMPFAQDHHPIATGGDLSGRLPADFVCEALDQTRGWFYSLLAESTLLFDETAYRNVVCLGLILDAEGQKMSKSPRQRHRAVDRHRPPGRRRLPLVPAHRAEPLGVVPLQPRGGRRRQAPLPADPVEHLLVPRARTRPCPTAGRPGGAARRSRRPPPHRPVDPVAPRRHPRRGDRAPGGLRRDDRRPRARRVRGRPQQLVRAHLAAPLLGRRPRGGLGRRAAPPSRPCTSAWRRWPSWWRRSARSWPRRCTATWWPRTTRTRPRASTWPTGRSRAAATTRTWRRRWPRPARW